MEVIFFDLKLNRALDNMHARNYNQQNPPQLLFHTVPSQNMYNALPATRLAN